MKRKRYDEDRTDVSAIEFEWYPPKAESNFKKHKVSFELACTVFGDKKFVDFPDRDHSDYESRYLGIGRAENDQLLSVIFTTRETRIRIISARVAERWERRAYEIANGEK